MKRRELLQTMVGGTVVAAASLALPGRVFAQASGVSDQHRRLLELARAQVNRLENVLWRTDIVGVADFALHSSLPRLHFVNLDRGEVRSFLVAHGKGSDPEHDGFLKVFSNQFNSLATSRGAFVTGEWYRGKYGASMRLNGIDPDNNNAYDRAIVMHPAWYANPDMLARYGKLGRSDGCFAMPEADFAEALLHLGAGRLLYADRLGIS